MAFSDLRIFTVGGEHLLSLFFNKMNCIDYTYEYTYIYI